MKSHNIALACQDLIGFLLCFIPEVEEVHLPPELILQKYQFRFMQALTGLNQETAPTLVHNELTVNIQLIMCRGVVLLGYKFILITNDLCFQFHDIIEKKKKTLIL